MVFLQDSTAVVGEVVQTSASKLETEAVLPGEEAGVMLPLLLDPGLNTHRGRQQLGAVYRPKILSLPAEVREGNKGCPRTGGLALQPEQTFP